MELGKRGNRAQNKSGVPFRRPRSDVRCKGRLRTVRRIRIAGAGIAVAGRPGATEGHVDHLDHVDHVGRTRAIHIGPLRGVARNAARIEVRRNPTERHANGSDNVKHVINDTVTHRIAVARTQAIAAFDNRQTGGVVGAGRHAGARGLRRAGDSPLAGRRAGASRTAHAGQAGVAGRAPVAGCRTAARWIGTGLIPRTGDHTRTGFDAPTGRCPTTSRTWRAGDGLSAGDRAFARCKSHTGGILGAGAGPMAGRRALAAGIARTGCRTFARQSMLTGGRTHACLVSR